MRQNSRDAHSVGVPALDSLDGADPDIDRLWARKAGDRLAAYRRGELAARDLRDIIARCQP